MYKIKIICAWCQRVLGEKESNEPGDTHGICASCLKRQNEEIAKQARPRGRAVVITRSKQ